MKTQGKKPLAGQPAAARQAHYDSSAFGCYSPDSEVTVTIPSAGGVPVIHRAIGRIRDLFRANRAV